MADQPVHIRIEYCPDPAMFGDPEYTALILDACMSGGDADALRAQFGPDDRFGIDIKPVHPLLEHELAIKIMGDNVSQFRDTDIPEGLR